MKRSMILTMDGLIRALRVPEERPNERPDARGTGVEDAPLSQSPQAREHPKNVGSE